MKRLSLLGFVGLLASVLAGCPIFPDNGGHGGSQTSTGEPGGCSLPSDCQQNETCGSDGQCHSGDCSFWGCTTGYTCQVNPASGSASCQPNGSTSSGTGGAGGATTSSSSSSSTSSGGNVVYCGHPSDCPAGETCAPDGTCHMGNCSANGCIYGYTCATDGTCQGSPNACDKDSDCMAGYVCVAGPKGGGLCTQPSDQCFDQSQCDAGDKCVAGKCTQACTKNADCRDGYACDTALGICDKPVQACKVTNDCGSANLVCVGGACVPRATNGSCSNPGDVWTENGCIPNQAPAFTCVMDGVQDACAVGSICLHHSCWISCDMPNQSVCTNQPTLNTCKPVVDGTSTYNVCGTSQNLGGQCDPTAGKNCTGGQVCIDGFCK